MKPFIQNWKSLFVTATACLFAATFSGSAQTCATAPSGVVSWWAGDGTANDLVGSNHGIVIGNTTYVAGKVDQTFSLDGSGDIIKIGSPTNLQLQNFTIEAWVKRNNTNLASFGTSGNGHVFGYGNDGYVWLYQNNGTLVLHKVGTGSSSYSSFQVVDTNWHHIAVTKSGATVVFFLDGVAYASSAFTDVFAFTSEAAIGGRADNSDNSLIGAIDEIAIYNRGLNASEIQAIYNASSAGKCKPSCVAPAAGLVGWWPGEGSAVDLVSSNNGTLNNVSFAAGKVGQAFQFNTTGANVVVPASSNLNVRSLTIEGWIYPTDASGRPIVEYASSTSFSGVNFWTGINGSGSLYANIRDTSIGGHAIQTGAGLLSANQWQHVALTYSSTSGQAAIYLNGVAVAQSSLGTNFVPATAFPLNLGYRPTGSTDPGGGTRFAGLMDEISVYNRALSASEVALIYNSGGAGKCSSAVPPVISQQPLSQSVNVGENATFSVSAGGTGSLSYQWRFSGTNIASATSSGFTVSGATTNLSGDYSVLVSNAYGSITSSNATLTVIIPSCVAPVAGLVGWWPGEGNGVDLVSGNNGSLNNISFATGKVGQAFQFNTAGANVMVPASINLNVRSLTIEGWIYPTDVSGGRPIVEYASSTSFSGVNFWSGVNGSGSLYANIRDTSIGGHAIQTDSGLLSANQWQHVGLTYNSTSGQAAIYLNGAAVAQSNVGTNFVPATAFPLNLGYRPPGSTDPGGGTRFAGLMDEISVYNRALSSSEIAMLYNARSAGKCSAVAPIIVQQPQSQTVAAGGNVVFSVSATGTVPLSYQWRFNGTNIVTATSSEFTLTGTTTNLSGEYSVIITNGYGSVTSANATLTVTPEPSCVAPAAGLVGWWPGEGGGEEVVSGNNGSVQNVSFANGKVRQCFQFNTTGANVLVPASSNLNVRSFTVEGWIFPTDVSIGRPILEYAAVGSFAGVHFWLGNNGSGSLYANLRDIGSGFHTLNTSAGVLLASQWQHVALTYNANDGQAHIYLNGGVVAQSNLGSDFVPATAFPINIGYRPAGSTDPDGGRSFAGLMDEMSVYNRALSSPEVSLIYNARGAGKCNAVAPVITQHPSSQNVNVEANVTFLISAGGTPRLSYQWQKNGVDLAAATNLSLPMLGVQTSDSGTYSVIISNAYGTVTSSNAVLAVNVPSCVAPLSGLVSWWPGNGGSEDLISGNHGTLIGNTTIGSGRVGQAFVFDGSGDIVTLGNPTNLQLQNFTIEAWTKRNSTTAVSAVGGGHIFGYGNLGPVLLYQSDGTLVLNRVGTSSASYSPFRITDTNWHHVAVTKSNTTVFFYLDGLPYASSSFTASFSFSTDAAIGGRADNLGNSFMGAIDELGVYNRPLNSSEIQAIYNAFTAGKCSQFPPAITQQPQTMSAVRGQDVAFSVSASGSVPLHYQWLFDGTNDIAGATNSSLFLTNVQFSHAGNYSVVVTNPFGSATSSNATLFVTLPPANVRVLNTAAMAGGSVTVPIVLVANGNENAVGFSLNFPTQRVAYVSATLGSAGAGANMFLNTTEIANGKLGVALAVASGAAFNAGTNELIRLVFTTATTTNSTNVSITFGDVPTTRQISDAQAQNLSATYSNGIISLARTEFEADVAPRPSGNYAVTIIDWVQVGRFAAQLDSPADSGEFQRTDCAPRANLGDGRIKVTDWVQAGRYAAGLDPLTALGGPLSDTGNISLFKGGVGKASGGREVLMNNATSCPGVAITLPVYLQSEGNENALGFSLTFDPTKVAYTGTALGNGATGATLNVNTNQIALGKVGFGLGLQIGTTFSAGLREILKASFTPALGSTGTVAVAFGDQPVFRSISDTTANELTATYVASSLVVNPVPSVNIVLAGTNTLLSWPAWASGFSLESAASASANSWTNAAVIRQTNANDISVTMPASGETKFFRLRNQ